MYRRFWWLFIKAPLQQQGTQKPYHGKCVPGTGTEKKLNEPRFIWVPIHSARAFLPCQYFIKQTQIDWSDKSVPSCVILLGPLPHPLWLNSTPCNRTRSSEARWRWWWWSFGCLLGERAERDESLLNINGKVKSVSLYSWAGPHPPSRLLGVFSWNIRARGSLFY